MREAANPPDRLTKTRWIVSPAISSPPRRWPARRSSGSSSTCRAGSPPRASIQRVFVNLSGGFAASRIVKAEVDFAPREITDSDMRQVLERGFRMRDAGDRQVIHSIPVGFAVDDSRGIRDPRGMIGERLGVNMHIVTASSAVVRNHTVAIGRAHLEVDALVVSPYAAGLACLVEDEMRLG